MATPFDVIVVGAGPAGATAATYLARYQRSVLLLHDGASRARWIPSSHNTPGFPQGVSGSDLLDRLNAQARGYGVQGAISHVDRIERTAVGHFRVTGSAGSEEARFVLLATGIQDKLPAVSGVEQAMLKGVLRVCPICDAYEARDKKLAILGDGSHALREARFLSDYTKHITLLRLDPAEDARCKVMGAPSAFPQQQVATKDLSFNNRGLTVRLGEREVMHFDVCYAAMGCSPQLGMISALGVRRDAVGAVLVDEHQQSSEPGLYVAGDVVRGLNQIVIAAAEGAIAATAIHNRLRAPASLQAALSA